MGFEGSTQANYVAQDDGGFFGAGGFDLTDALLISDSALTWFATATEKPIAQRQPTNLIDSIIGPQDNRITSMSPLLPQRNTLIALVLVALVLWLVLRRG